jgi:protein-tyrosine phosphatase
VIDLHCHLLPGLDDGAQDLQTSLTMARQAVDQGVTHVACTPHILLTGRLS